jgi:hypothetical protein
MDCNFKKLKTIKKMKFVANFFIQFLSLFSLILKQKITNKPINFIVKPNSLWTAYEIFNETEISKRISNHLDLAPIKVFQTSIPKKYLFFRFFEADTDFSKGYYLQVMTVIQEHWSKKKRFIILDSYCNTVDPIILITPNARFMNIIDTNQNLGAYMDSEYLVLGKKKNSQVKLLTNEFSTSCNKNIYYGTNQYQLPHFLDFDKNLISKVLLLDQVIIQNKLWSHGINNTSKPEFTFFYPNTIPFKIEPNKISNEDTPYDEMDKIPIQEMFIFSDMY